MKPSSTAILPYPYNFIRDMEIKEINNPNLLSDLDFVVDSLTDREKDVVRLRYREGLSLEESGNVIGVSKEYVRTLINDIAWRINHTFRYNKIAYGKMPNEYQGIRPLTIKDLDLPKRVYVKLERSGNFELYKLNKKSSSDSEFEGMKLGAKTFTALNRQTEHYGVKVLIEK